jgi:hypothetical protein
MKLINLLFESKQTNDKFEEFAETRGKGAAKIASTAEEKGGLSIINMASLQSKGCHIIVELLQVNLILISKKRIYRNT